MLKRLLVVLTSLSLLAGAVALVWQAYPAKAQGQPHTYTLYAPFIAKDAFPNGSPSSIQLSINTSIASNGNINYRIQMTNLADKAVNVLPLEFGYDASVLKFLAAPHTPDSPTPGALRWNNLAGYTDFGPLGPAGSATATQSFTITMGAVICPPNGIVSVNALVSGAIDSANQVIAPAQATAGQQVCTPLQISKSLNDLPSRQALVRDVVTFTIAVTNPIANATAPAALQNVSGPIVVDRFNPDVLGFRSEPPGRDRRLHADLGDHAHYRHARWLGDVPGRPGERDPSARREHAPQRRFQRDGVQLGGRHDQHGRSGCDGRSQSAGAHRLLQRQPEDYLPQHPGN